MKILRLGAALLFLSGAAQAAPVEGKKEPWAEQLLTHEEISASRELRELHAQVKSRNIPNVGFNFDSAVVRSESYALLDIIADFMLKYPDLKLRITAHTCKTGSRSYNLDLSERRAKTIMNHLVQRGVPPPSIRFKGAGFDEPVAGNATEEGRQKNRRVEFRFTEREWNSVY